MHLIAAAAKDWGIGRGNGLLFRIPRDMQFFRETTLNKVVVMGRKTLESFPNQKPLPKRTNIVLTQNQDYQAEGVLLCHSEAELLRLLADYDPESVFVCGGAAIYRMLLPRCRLAYITKVDAAAPADSYLPDLDADPAWILRDTSAPIVDNGYTFTFNIYENTKKL